MTIRPRFSRHAQTLYALCGLLFALLFMTAPLAAADKPPNIVIIFADDMGYGDLGCYGHPTIRTPNLDRMAAEGMRFTQFYSAAPVCTPSRAALLTGRLPIRNGMCSNKVVVLFPDSPGGLPAEEVTLAEALSSKGYSTACIGKWHLGHLPQYLPTRNGFDSYFGIPYSNDMDYVGDKQKRRAAFLDPDFHDWNVPLMRDEKIVERPADQTTLTKRYAEAAVRFINSAGDGPFFLYFAQTMPHVPLFRSSKFVDTSTRGLYGDVIEEIDWSVGEVLNALRERKLDRSTLVFFTSDNGPWLSYDQQGGSAGLLRGGKGSTWEGGMREPAIAWWPGKIPAGTVTQELASTMDLFVTGLALADVPVPTDRVIDGVDIRPVLFGNGPSPRDTMFYYLGERLTAVRKGPWKAHYLTTAGLNAETKENKLPELYHLLHDPSEKYDVSADHPDVLAEIEAIAARHKKTVVPVKSQLDLRTGS